MVSAVLSGMLITLVLSIVSFVTAVILGIALCVLIASKHVGVSRFFMEYCKLFQKIPPLVALMLMALIINGTRFSGNFLVAYVGLANFIGVNLATIFYFGYLSVSKGEIEAGRTLGLSKKQTFYHICLPKVVDGTVDSAIAFYITTLQLTSVSSILGLTELIGVTNAIGDEWLGMVIAIIFFVGTCYIAEFLIHRLGESIHRAIEGGRI